MGLNNPNVKKRMYAHRASWYKTPGPASESWSCAHSLPPVPSWKISNINENKVEQFWTTNSYCSSVSKRPPSPTYAAYPCNMNKARAHQSKHNNVRHQKRITQQYKIVVNLKWKTNLSSLKFPSESVNLSAESRKRSHVTSGITPSNY